MKKKNTELINHFIDAIEKLNNVEKIQISFLFQKLEEILVGLEELDSNLIKKIIDEKFSDFFKENPLLDNVLSLFYDIINNDINFFINFRKTIISKFGAAEETKNETKEEAAKVTVATLKITSLKPNSNRIAICTALANYGETITSLGLGLSMTKGGYEFKNVKPEKFKDLMNDPLLADCIFELKQ